MASIISHAVVAVSLGQLAPVPIRQSRRFWLFAIFLSVMPDLDVLGFSRGIEYGDLWGHRGMTHSLGFAAVAGILAAVCVQRGDSRWFWRLAILLMAITASHGVLDAMTNGGLGIAFLAPWDHTRYFFPWRPILVSPMGVASFFSGRGLRVLTNEVLWIWAPAVAFGGCIYVLRRLIKFSSEVTR